MRMKKKGNKKQIIEDFGSMESYCPDCDYSFSVSWQMIFDLQECTHGYVGYEYFHDEFSCPLCGKMPIASDGIHKIIQNPEDDELLF